MKFRYPVLFVCMLLALVVTGCGPGKPKVEKLDLDKVISVMMDTLKEMDKEASTADKADGSAEKSPVPATTPATAEKDKKKLSSMTEMGPEKEKEFLEKFAANLNKAQVRSTPVGVAMLDNGTLEGFEDPNKNNKKDSGEKTLFKLYVDKKRDRIIATDTIQGRHRDHSLSSGLGGLMMGYMLGNMLNRQSSSGFDTRQFEQMKMSLPTPQASTQKKSMATGKAADEKTAGAVKKKSGGSKGFKPGRSGRRRR